MILHCYGSLYHLSYPDTGSSQICFKGCLIVPFSKRALIAGSDSSLNQVAENAMIPSQAFDG